MTPLACAETEIIEAVHFSSGALTLEGRLCYPESGSVRGAVVLAGPHPMLGGDMDNNVVRGLSAALARRGIATLCFNYQGVGGSEGASADVLSLAEFWLTARTSAEVEYANDLRAAIVAIGECVANERVALIGYSFGCSLLATVEVEPQCPLVLIAPTIGRHDYDAFTQLSNPMLVVAPDGDFAADAIGVTQWFDALHAPKQLVRGDWDAHFFRGLEDRLAGLVSEFLTSRWEGE